jgi:predicted dehydrogenase
LSLPNETAAVNEAASQLIETVSQRPTLIAGYGSIGRRHVQNLQSLGCSQFVFFRTHRGTLPDDTSAVNRRFAENRQAAFQANGNEAAAPPSEKAAWVEVHELDRAWMHRPRIAVVSNPTAAHMKVALASARNGCDLFIEKPLSDSLDDCEELSEIVRRNNLVAMIGCQFRFHPLLIRLREGLSAGRLGAVVGARAEWGEYLPEWHPWEDHRQGYSARADLGGGVVLTLIHPLDYLYWLFGPVERVQASTRSVAALQTPAGEDWAEITIEFCSGVVGQVHLDYLQRPAVHRLTVCGDHGRAEWDCVAGTLRWETAGSSGNAAPITTIETIPPRFERNSMFIDEMQHFLRCVETRQTPAITLADGIAVLKIALAAKQSAREVRRTSESQRHG